MDQIKQVMSGPSYTFLLNHQWKQLVICSKWIHWYWEYTKRKGVWRIPYHLYVLALLGCQIPPCNHNKKRVIAGWLSFANTFALHKYLTEFPGKKQLNVSLAHFTKSPTTLQKSINSKEKKNTLIPGGPSKPMTPTGPMSPCKQQHIFSNWTCR